MKIVKITNEFIISGKFDKDHQERIITEDAEKKEAIVFLGDKNEFTQRKARDFFEWFFRNIKRNYSIDASSFTNAILKEKDIIEIIIEANEFVNGKNCSFKSKRELKLTPSIFSHDFKDADFKETVFLAKQSSEIRYLQDAPSNQVGIHDLAYIIKKKLKFNSDIKIKTYDKNELSKMGMNLMLSVNKGSSEDIKMLVAEYTGNPDDLSNKTVIVGKGIVFDTGGYNLKRGKYMSGMKYDMSGAAIATFVLDSVAKMNIKTNLSIVLPLTDNAINDDGNLMESIYTSYSGTTVEVVDTDAEGRLILADGISFASKKLKASKIIDIATLTGAALYALGKYYNPVWTSNPKRFNVIKKASDIAKEFVWEMPLDNIYIKHLKEGTFADIRSCSTTEHSDSNIAAAWLNDFALGTEYIHFDIAGTGDIDERGRAPLLKTLFHYFKNTSK